MLRVFADRVRPAPEAVQTETARAERSLHEYSRQCWHVVRPGDLFRDGWVFGCLCEHYQAVVEGQIRKLAVACPPRHAKSLVACVFTPTWVWTRDPRKRFIFTTYSAHLSQRDSKACRDVFQSKWYSDRWGHLFKLKEDSNTMARFDNDVGGFRIATTPGGWATGEGADIIVADDITSVEDSFSPAALEHAWRYWTQTMTMRFHDPESIARVISMQRTSKGDLIGRAVAENLGYEVLVLPFEAEPKRYWLPDPAQSSESRKPEHAIEPTSLQRRRPELLDPRKHDGEILWPERFSNPETIRDLRKTVQAGAAGQLQQRPEGEVGAIFKRSKFRLFYPKWDSERGLVFVMPSADGLPDREYRASECLWYQTCDTAMKAGQENDYTVVLTAAKTPGGELLVYDVFRDRLLVPEQWPAMKQFRDGRAAWDATTRSWVIAGKQRPWPAPLAFQSVEGKNSGIGLLQTARSEGYPLKELTADVNKVLRAAPVATMYESGMVYHNAEGEWRADFESELAEFPNPPDDQVDSVAYAGYLFIHDNILAAYTGPVVYNERVFQEIEERAQVQENGGYIPPARRERNGDAPRENIDDILAALRGAPRPARPVTDDDGTIDRRVFEDD